MEFIFPSLLLVSVGPGPGLNTLKSFLYLGRSVRIEEEAASGRQGGKQACLSYSSGSRWKVVEMVDQPE
jgi:hypothetical protein